MIVGFEYYLKKGAVKKSRKDVERAKSLLKKARKRILVLGLFLQAFPWGGMKVANLGILLCRYKL